MTDDDLREAVEAALRGVEDPGVGANVFEAGLIDGISIDGRDVTIRADLSGFDSGEEVASAVVRAVSAVEGVEGVHVEHATPDPEGGTPGLDGVERVVAVASAKGGVGKTTVAVNLACALAADGDVGIFDADIHGPNVPSMLGAEGPVYSDDGGHPLPVDAGGIDAMSVGLMQEGAPLAWRGAMAHDALTELFRDTAWGDRDVLVIDLPPGTGDVVLTTLQEVRVDGVVFVTTPFHAAVTDTRRSLQLFRENDVPVLGVVVNMGSFTCPDCGGVHELFPGGSPLDGLDAPVLAELPFTTDLQGRPAPGDVPAPMRTLARRVRKRLDEIWDPPIPEGALDLRGVPADERHEAVAGGFSALDAGEPFVLVSDRDPTPVRGYLADLAGVEEGAFEPFRVRRPNPETWLLETVRP